MAEIDLFQAALGLPEPWRVVGAEFSADRKRLDLYLDFPKGSRFACPQGDAAACAVHDTSDKTCAEVSMAEVTRVGVDETSAKRGQDYVSLFVDLDAPKPRVLFATEGRDHSTVARFATDLAAHGGDPAGVRDVSADMSPAFEKGVRASLPKAYLTYDRYHLVSHATKAVDEVRRAEAKTHPELKGTRYVWLKRPEHLTVKQAATLQGLTPASVGLRTARAYRWRLAFDAFFEQPRELAEAYLERWYEGAVRSRLQPIIDFAHMIGEHWEGVLRWHWTKINNGVLEGINSLVQASKRRARGYRNKRNLIAMIYLIAGRLDFSPTHTN